MPAKISIPYPLYRRKVEAPPRAFAGNALYALQVLGLTIHIVIIYGIADNRRRTRTTLLLEDVGGRVQYSLFEAARRCLSSDSRNPLGAGSAGVAEVA